MALTAAQANQVMLALTGKVDDDTFKIVKNLLDLNILDNSIPAGESYNNIKKYCVRLRERLMTSGKGIVAEDPGQEMMIVYMDRNKVRRLFNAVPDGGYLAAMPGIHTTDTGEEQLTISLLAADANLNILPDHIQGSATGEQCWDKRSVMNNLEAILL